MARVAPCWSWPRLAHEHQTGRLDPGLVRLPLGLPARRIGAILLGGNRCLFVFEVLGVDARSHRAVVHRQPRSANLPTSPRRVKAFSRQRCTNQSRCAPEIFFGL
jgi:hypothetical protein